MGGLSGLSSRWRKTRARRRVPNGIEHMKWERQRYQWKIRDREISLGNRTLVIGALTVAPRDNAKGDSSDRRKALDTVLEMQQAGADLIDLSAYPGPPAKGRLTANEELRRLVPLLRKLRHKLDVPLVVSTYHAETAERALELGAAVINDLGCLAFDPSMPQVIKQHDAGLIVTHSRGTPDTWAKLPPVSNLMEGILRELEAGLARARLTGIDRRRIVLDPGLGLGKRGLENYRILAQLERLEALHQPILVSPSRQPFLTESIRAPESEQLFGAAAVVTMAICAGVHLIRVCEVAEMAQVARAADRVFEAAITGRS